MKTPVIKAVIILAVALISSQSHAQIAQVSTKNYEAKQRISVDLKVTPSIEGFRAGVKPIDSAQGKFRLWITNSEEKKCFITIVSAAGSLWTNHFKDAYFNQVFDLSSLDDGEYTIKIVCDKESFERKIRLYSNSYIKRELRIE